MDAPQEVPETRLCDDLVGRKDAHTVNLRVRLTLSGEVAADDLEFLERHLENVPVSQRFIRTSEVPSSPFNPQSRPVARLDETLVY